MKKICLFLILYSIVFFISGKKLSEFDNIYKPRELEIMGNDLYVVDGSVIKYFSMKDFKFIKQIGKRGEGPGEFKWSPHIQVFPDYVFAASIDKVSFFTRQGKFIKEKKVPNRMWVERVDGGFLGRKFNFDRKNNTSTISTKIFDDNFNVIKEVFSYIPEDNVILIGPIRKKLDIPLFPNYTRAATNGKRIYFADTKRGFYIEIYDHKGNKINTIKKDFKQMKISEELKKLEIDKLKKYKSWERDKKRFNYIFPEFFPAFKLHIVNNDKIYLLTYLTREKEREIIILDLEGNILKKTFVPDEKIFKIFNNKFYYFVDNDDEEVMEFHSIDL